jgi:WD40 repeat protein
VSATSPYLFSAAEDKTVKCWDLEQNKVVRHYHGHLSGVYCAALHPTLDILVTGGRDSSAFLSRQGAVLKLGSPPSPPPPHGCPVCVTMRARCDNCSK